MTATAQQTLTAAIYARISKTDEKFDKVANQVKQCRALAEAQGYEVAEDLVFADDGVSAFREQNGDRPGMDAVVAAARAGRFDVLLTVNQDRIGRGSDAAMLLAAVCAEQGIRWHLVHGGLRDFDEPASDLITYVLNWQAKQDSATKVGKIRDRKQADRDSGHPGHGPRPFGYSQDRMSIVEDEAALIRKGVDMLLKGTDRMKVVQHFNVSGMPTTRGGTVWRASTVYDVLGRWRNCAVVEHNGEPVGEGVWPEILPREDVENVRVLLATPPRGREGGRAAETMLSGLALCHCGARMHAHGMNWGRVYRCSTLSTPQDRREAPALPDGTPGKHAAIKIEILDQVARGMVVTHYAEPFPSNAVQSAEASDVVPLHKELAQVRAQGVKLLDLYLEGALAEAVYKTKNTALRKREAEISGALTKAANASANAHMLVELNRFMWVGEQDWHMGKLREQLGKQFDGLPLRDQRALVAAIGTMTVLPSKGRGKGADRVKVENL